MQTVGVSSHVPVLLPVRHHCSDRVSALLSDYLSDELRRRHIDDVHRAELGAPDGPIDTLLQTLENNASVQN